MMISSDCFRFLPIFFDSSKALSATAAKLGRADLKQSRLLSLQFAKNCYRKISNITQTTAAYMLNEV